MRKALLILLVSSIFCCAGCTTNSSEDVTFQMPDGTLKIPRENIYQDNEFSGYIDPAKEMLDNEDSGSILIKIPQSEIDAEIPGFQRSRTTDISLVHLYNRPPEYKKILESVLTLIDDARPWNKDQEFDAFRAYRNEDAWYLLAGPGSGDGTIEPDKFLGSCFRSTMGISCEFYVELLGGYYAFSVRGENYELAREIAQYTSERMLAWVQ